MPHALTQLLAALERGRDRLAEAFVWGRDRAVRRWGSAGATARTRGTRRTK